MNYTCKETCNMDKPCKNKHCSANPKYIPPVPKELWDKVAEYCYNDVIATRAAFNALQAKSKKEKK